MAYSTVKFALTTSIERTTFYVTNGDSECIEDKDIPTVFSELSPGKGYATANSGGDCAFKDSHIHLYIWADEEETEQVSDIKLYEKNSTNKWEVDVEHTADSYNIKPTKEKDNEYEIEVTG
ncbi:MAG: hypothetical protein AAF560_11920 [Acidobacteriota bacterium]